MGREDVPLSFVQASTPNVGRPYYAVSPLESSKPSPPSHHLTTRSVRLTNGFGGLMALATVQKCL